MSSSRSSSSVSEQTSSQSSSSISTLTSSSLSSLSSTSSKSSISSPTTSSQSSNSPSSSSISSESSPWDTQWFSILYCPRPVVRDYKFEALTEVDLRHSDAEILAALGPLIINYGGEYGETVLARDEREILDGLRVTKTFDVVEDAELWQNTITRLLRDRMAELRTVYLTQYPGDFELRHRRC